MSPSLFGKTDKDAKDGKNEREGAPHGSPTPAPRGAERSQPAAAGGRNDRGGNGMANIGKSITISGDLTGEEDLVIEGKVEGKVSLPNSQLTIGANGSVKAEVQAKSVVVVGRVSGDIRGTERVEIQATGHVDGDVTAPKLSVAEGAVLNGSIQMADKADKAGTGSAKPGAAPAGTGGSGGPGGEVRKAG